MKTTANAPPQKSLWILSPWGDILFFLAPPLLALAPAIFVDLKQFDSTHLLLLLAVVAAGHHVPGFIRAYSDPELMAAYRGRMIVAPILLVATTLWMVFKEIPGIMLVPLLWGVWHFLMQNYGLMRIYGVKQSEISRTTATLDWLIMLTWIAAVYLNHPSWSYKLQRQIYDLGVPFPPVGVFPRLGLLAWIAAGIVSLIYVAYALVRWRRGEPANPLKYVLLLSTLIFFAAAFNLSRSILLVTVLVELVHDLQYYALAWAFQRRLSQRHGGARSFLRLLFRPTLLMLSLYVGICLIYGAVLGDYASNYLFEGSFLAQTAKALLLAATIYHFYVDGFIWKVRQPRTREYLGIEAEASALRTASAIPSTWRRSLLHLAIYAALVGLFVSARDYGREHSLEISAALARRLPQLGDAHHTLGYELQQRGQTDYALREYALALELGVDQPVELRQRMSSAFADAGEYEHAIAAMREALELAPANKIQQVAGQFALLLAECPRKDLRDGAGAVKLAEFALPADGPQRPLYLDILAASYCEAGRYDDALQTARRALNEARKYRRTDLVGRIQTRLTDLQTLASDSRRPLALPASGLQ